MTEPRTDSDGLFAAVEPWVILAVSTLITACYRQNFATLDLLRGPVRCSGQVQGKVAIIDVPTWFPTQEAVFELADGILYAKLKDLPLPGRAQQVGETTRMQVDLQSIAVPPRATATLTYIPWYRFLAEPAHFDAMERAAEYVAACFQFLLRRNMSPPRSRRMPTCGVSPMMRDLSSKFTACAQSRRSLSQRPRRTQPSISRGAASPSIGACFRRPTRPAAKC